MDRANKISMAQNILNYTFKNEDILWEALQAPGSNVVMLNGRMITQGNKGLATLGDAVATLVVKLDCYNMNRSIGDISVILQSSVNNTRFTYLCDKVGLAACINHNPSQRGIIAPRTYADTLEAVIGAVYQDGGFDKAKLVMQTLQILEYDKY